MDESANALACNDGDHTKLQELLARAGARIIELKEEAVVLYNRAAGAEARVANASSASSDIDSNLLVQLQDELAMAKSDLDSAVTSKHDTERALHLAKQELRDHALHHQDQLEARSNKASLGIERTLIEHLQASNTNLKASVQKLLTQNEKLEAANSAKLEAMNERDDEILFLRSRGENMEHDLDEMRMKLGTVDQDYARLEIDHMRLLERSNASQLATTNDQSLTSRLRTEISELKSELDQVRILTAFKITQLDAAFDGWRLFDCYHDDLRNVPDGRNSTHQTSVHAIINGFFELWMHDTKFLKEYNDSRRAMLQHHRAHERANEGRGVASWRLRREFKSLDEKRGVKIKY